MACQQPEIIRSLESASNNRGLDEQEKTSEKYRTICLASVFGGTSTY
jgi:hypothetical protein